MQIPLSVYQEMVAKDEIFSGIGFEYKNKYNQTYMEFHIDNHPMFTGMGSVHPFGGNLSIRKPTTEKLMVLLGQDECIFVNTHSGINAGLVQIGKHP